MRTRVEGVKKAENFADIISGSSLSGFGRSAATCLTYVHNFDFWSTEEREWIGAVERCAHYFTDLNWMDRGGEGERDSFYLRPSRKVFTSSVCHD